MNYYRYCSAAISPYTRERYGIFISVWHLIRDKKVTAEEEAAYWKARAWFETHLIIPPFYKEGNPDRALTWFKATAMDCHIVQELKFYRDLAQKYGVQIDLVSTDAPGEIIYEDDYQIGALQKKALQST
ncbi:hypothetical protein [Rariglobus hedericola]|uniref:Uncharacterized protein n=1 Tax=Rariglobus hedericola TaxID=2597822 RepID=A0A556QRH7_9BACT|nr:hypothetical protein [Rariglobus hedericola]TSJ79238.1 hypothetical protein FPL22_08085 [Rariglobus hedericola]